MLVRNLNNHLPPVQNDYRDIGEVKGALLVGSLISFCAATFCSAVMYHLILNSNITDLVNKMDIKNDSDKLKYSSITGVAVFIGGMLASVVCGYAAKCRNELIREAHNNTTLLLV